MKNIVIYIIAMTCFLCTTGFAKTTRSTNTWYISGFAGTNIATSGDTDNPSINLVSEPEYKLGYDVGFDVGYKFARTFRVALELAHQKMPMDDIKNAIPGMTVDLKNSDTSTNLVMLNAYYDFSFFDKWVPYIGGGLGYVNVRNTIRPNPPIISPFGTINKKTLNYNAFGYQGIIGLAYQLTKNIDLAINYKYFATTNAKTIGSTNLGRENNFTEQKISNNLIEFNISYFFAST